MNKDLNLCCILGLSFLCYYILSRYIRNFLSAVEAELYLTATIISYLYPELCNLYVCWFSVDEQDLKTLTWSVQ